MAGDERADCHLPAWLAGALIGTSLGRLRPRTSHPCCVIIDMDPPGIDRRARGVQLRLRDGQRVRARADGSVQTESVMVGSAISLFSGAGGLDLGVEAAGKAIRRIMRADVIVIDDIGLLPVTTDTAEALYRVVDAAYEKREEPETLHRPVKQPAPDRVRRTHAQDHRQRHRRPAPPPRPHRHDRRRQHPPHPSHRRQGGDATDQLSYGQNTWPPPGSSVGHGWAVLLSATGQIPLALDSGLTGHKMINGSGAGRGSAPCLLPSARI